MSEKAPNPRRMLANPTRHPHAQVTLLLQAVEQVHPLLGHAPSRLEDLRVGLGHARMLRHVGVGGVGVPEHGETRLRQAPLHHLALQRDPAVLDALEPPAPPLLLAIAVEHGRRVARTARRYVTAQLLAPVTELRKRQRCRIESVTIKILDYVIVFIIVLVIVLLLTLYFMPP